MHSNNSHKKKGVLHDNDLDKMALESKADADSGGGKISGREIEFFKKVSKQQIRDLYRLYQNDFLLAGYAVPEIEQYLALGMEEWYFIFEGLNGKI